HEDDEFAGAGLHQAGRIALLDYQLHRQPDGFAALLETGGAEREHAAVLDIEAVAADQRHAGVDLGPGHHLARRHQPGIVHAVLDRRVDLAVITDEAAIVADEERIGLLARR